MRSMPRSRRTARSPTNSILRPANLALKAKILDRMGRPEEADGLFRKSIALVDTMIQRASTLSVERQLLAEMSDIYSAYFAYLSDQNRYEAALQVLENVRGRLEAEALEHHSSQPLHQPTAQEQELTRLNIALINTDDPKTRDALLDRIYQTEINLGPSKLATASISHPVTLAQLQRTISPGQLLIEYVLAKPASYALAVTDSSIRAYRLKTGPTIESEVKRYREEIHAKLSDPSLGQALFNDLLAPIQEYSTHKDLVIVPDGELHLLPFSALVNHGAYVLASHTVDVAPSSTAFELLERALGTDRHQRKCPISEWRHGPRPQTAAIQFFGRSAARRRISSFHSRTVKQKLKPSPAICHSPTRSFWAGTQRKPISNARLVKAPTSSISHCMAMPMSTTPIGRR